MATILSKDLKVTNGQVIKVQNDNRANFSNSAKSYYALWVKDGAEEYCLMFTEKEFTYCKKVLGTFDDEYKLGTIYSFNCINTTKACSKFLIKVKHINGDETCLFLGKSQLEKLKKRADTNIEDQPEKSWLTDLFD